jgi:hypothetical protein
LGRPHADRFAVDWRAIAAIGVEQRPSRVIDARPSINLTEGGTGKRFSWHQGGASVVLVAAAAMLWGTDALLRVPLLRHLSTDRLLQAVQLVFVEHLILTSVFVPVLWRGRDELRGCGCANGLRWQA